MRFVMKKNKKKKNASLGDIFINLNILKKKRKCLFVKILRKKKVAIILMQKNVL